VNSFPALSPSAHARPGSDPFSPAPPPYTTRARPHSHRRRHERHRCPTTWRGRGKPLRRRSRLPPLFDCDRRRLGSLPRTPITNTTAPLPCARQHFSLERAPLRHPPSPCPCQRAQDRPTTSVGPSLLAISRMCRSTVTQPRSSPPSDALSTPDDVPTALVIARRRAQAVARAWEQNREAVATLERQLVASVHSFGGVPDDSSHSATYNDDDDALPTPDLSAPARSPRPASSPRKDGLHVVHGGLRHLSAVTLQCAGPGGAGPINNYHHHHVIKNQAMCIGIKDIKETFD
jgi:hypothetical protein